MKQLLLLLSLLLFNFSVFLKSMNVPEAFLTRVQAREGVDKNDDLKGLKFLALLGKKDASPTMQARMEKVISSFRKKGFLSEDDNIYIKEMSQDAMKVLRDNGTPITYNAIRHGDTVWVTPDHGELPENESLSQLGHEIGHKLLEEGKILNLSKYFPEEVIAICFGSFGSLASLILYCRNDRKTLAGKRLMGITRLAPKTMLFFSLSLIAFNSLFSDENRQKLIEISCDLAAARTLPDGYKGGELFYKRSIESDDVVSFGHPSLRTRVMFHKAGALLNALNPSK